MVLDGAMGTAIQRDRPDEAGYRGERFADWPSDLLGNNDLLTITQPEIIAGIHREYLEAGADIIETNTFNANAVSLADYGLEELAYELNLESARLARREADAVATPEKPRYVGGALGPTTRTASISPGRQRPGRAQRVLRPARRGVPRGRPRPGRRRLGPARHRDDLRHPQRQGRDLRGRDALRGARSSLAGHHLRHHHRRLRPHPVGPGDRGVLGLGAARRARSPSVSTARSAPRRCVPTSPSWHASPTPSSPATRTPACPTPSVSTTRHPTRPPAILARVRGERLRQPGRRLLRHHARAHRRDRPRRRGPGARVRPSRSLPPCVSPASSRSRSPTTASSSTSASAPTSPARRSSAT